MQKRAKAQARSHRGGGEAWYGARSGGKVEVAWTQQRVRQLACGGRKELFPNKRERACMYVHERLQGRLDKPRGARHSLTEVLGDVAPPLVGRRASYDTGGVLKRHGHYTKTRKRCESFITPPTVLKRLGRFETPPRFIAAFAFSNMPERFKTGGVFHDIWGV